MIATGGSPILDYSLEIDDGSGYTGVSTNPIDPLVMSTIVTGLTSGHSYKFRYSARNLYGSSSYSPESTILAGTMPSKPVNVQTANSAASVVITWDAPL